MSAAGVANTAAPLRVRIIEPNALDVERHAALQQRVFGPILEENGIPLSRLGAEVFAWKLAPPCGSARIALVERDGELLSCCSAHPVELGAGDDRVRGWQLCDAATAPEARGRGLFGRVLRALRETTPPEDWLFAFPNGQSRGTFVRDAFHLAARVPLWVRPVTSRASAAEVEGVAPIDRFGPEHDELAQRLAARGGLTAVRSAAYLTWRYLRHPFFRYQCFELRREGRVDGLLVLNRMEARGRVSMWVMELLAVDRPGLAQLARAARSLAGAQRCDVVLSMSSTRLPGAVRLPACFLPKKHVLMVRSGGPGEPRPPGRWDVATGDWDAF